MSLSPDPISRMEVPQEAPQTAPRRSRKHVVAGLFFALFAFEIGLFLVVFPWMENWDLNYFQNVIPALRGVWNDSYFRGAVTGLGFVNIYIALVQVFCLIRRPRQQS